MQPGETNGPDELFKLLRERSLPVAMRGYDREATDRLLSQLEQGLEATLRQHGVTLARLKDLEHRVADGQEREEAVTEALVLATQIRADSEREGKEIRDRYVSEAEAIKEAAQRRAEEVVREAETRAQTIVGDAEANAHAFDMRIRDAQELAERIRMHLTNFLRSMLEEVDRRNEESASIVGDLLARTGETTTAGWHSDAAVPESNRDGTRGLAELGHTAGDHPPLGL